MWRSLYKYRHSTINNFECYTTEDDKVMSKRIVYRILYII